MDTSRRAVRVWDTPLRMFHWVLVVAIAVAFLSSEEDSALNQWHVLAGWVAGLLIVCRVAWGFMGGEHSRFSDFVRPSHVGHHLRELSRGRVEPSLGHNPLGGVAVLLLLGLTAATVWTGSLGEAAEDLHEIIAWALLGMVVVHVVAVLAMSLLQRENLVRAMVTGRKPRERHPDARDARPPRALAILLSLAVLTAAVAGVLQYDRSAFTLRSSGSLEHRFAAAEAPSRDEKSDEHED